MQGCRLADTHRRYETISAIQGAARWVGQAAKAQLPRQLDLKAPNPFKNIRIEPSLLPKSRFVDYNLVLKKKTLSKYGAYAMHAPGKKALPITTPAIVLDYTLWLLKNNRASRRGADPVQEEALLLQLKANQTAVMLWFDSELAKAGIPAGTPRHTQLLRTTVIPAHLALNFWTTAGKQSIRLDSAKMVPGLTDTLMMLAESFWEATVDLLKRGGKAAMSLLTILKWMAIAFGIGIGGLIIVNIVQGFGSD
jgi:hypothetical protein